VVGGERVDRVVIATGVGSVPLAKQLGVDLPILGREGLFHHRHGRRHGPTTALYLAEAKVGISGYDDAVRIAGVFELPGRDTVVEPGRIASFVRRAVGYLADWRPRRGVDVVLGRPAARHARRPAADRRDRTRRRRRERPRHARRDAGAGHRGAGRAARLEGRPARSWRRSRPGR
jgi:hypothetical protein